MGSLFCLFLGVNGIEQARKYAAAEEEGVFVEAVVKKKIDRGFRGRQLKVTYRQKEYWVKVTQASFDKSSFNGAINLKYDMGNDMLIDDGIKNREFIPSVILLIAAAGCIIPVFKK